MSAKSSRPRHRQKDRTSSDESDREVEERHHHRHDRHHRGGQHERRRSWSKSRSRSRSPKHQKEKPERESHNPSRDTKHHPLKHRNHECAGDKRHGRHRDKRDHSDTREEQKMKPYDRDRGKNVEARNGDKKPRVGEDVRQTGALRGKWDNDPGADTVSPRDKHRTSRGRENAQDLNRMTGQVRIKQERDLNDRRRIEDSKHKPENPFQIGEGNADSTGEEEPPQEKDKPNFSTSGKLTEDTNTYRGVVIKYNEPSEARKPKRKWRLYIFKGEQELPLVHVHRQSAYLLGRERLIADLPIDHPSCSKQHAVLQYRLVQYERPDGTMGKRVRPYIIDLESSNGTYINNNRIESKRYYELHEKDVVKFGYSTREYVLLHDKSKDDDHDDDLDVD